MSEKLFHTCDVTGETFTQEQWCEYCNAHRTGSDVVATYYGFAWNINNVCINAEVVAVFFVDNMLYYDASLAQDKDGKWHTGYSYWLADGGGGSAPYWTGKRYDTRRDALLACVAHAQERLNISRNNAKRTDYDDEGNMKIIDDSPKMRKAQKQLDDFRVSIETPQLTLF